MIKMETESEWRPEVGGKAWIVSGHDVLEVKVDILYETRALVSSYLHLLHRHARLSCKISALYPTSEMALASISIKVYNLEGEEISLQCKSTFELKPLEWISYLANPNDYHSEDETFCYFIYDDGSWRVDCNNRTICGDSPTSSEKMSIEAAKEAVDEWRMSVIKSFSK